MKRKITTILSIAALVLFSGCNNISEDKSNDEIMEIEINDDLTGLESVSLYVTVRRYNKTTESFEVYDVDSESWVETD